MDDQPKVIIETPPVPVTRGFKQQMFGPWTTHDPRVQQQIARAQTSAGSAQRKLKSTYPPAPVITEGETSISNGFEFSFRVVANAAGYNIYYGTVNNPAIAKLLQFQAQPPVVTPGQTINIQDITTTRAGTAYYWVASVNSAGKESARILAGGNSPAANSAKPLPSGGGSGTGAGGGAGKGSVVPRSRVLL